LLLRVQNNEDPPPEDRTPPVVSWVSPEPGTEVNGNVNLQFDALDNTGIDNIKVYINGALPDGFTLAGQDNEARYLVSWHTEDYTDGDYMVEVRAFDAAGNTGSAPAVSFTVVNNPPREPRVIWVPDDYEKIQDAINASEDGDTVRVRAGIYEEMVIIWEKYIWLESEEGPELTIIEANNNSYGIYIDGIQDTLLMIRGFTIQNAEFYGILLSEGSSAKIMNNILINSGTSNLRAWIHRSKITNNIMSISQVNASMNICTGSFYNNIISSSSNYALFNHSVIKNPLLVDFNLFWDFSKLVDEDGFTMGNHNLIEIDPKFEYGGFTLQDVSPCIDAGNPDIFDLDNSRSDIGVYGGPHSYP